MLLHSQKQVQNTDSFSTTPTCVQNWEIQSFILRMLNGPIITFLPTSIHLLHCRFPCWCLNFILVQFFNNPSYSSKTTFYQLRNFRRYYKILAFCAGIFWRLFLNNLQHVPQGIWEELYSYRSQQNFFPASVCSVNVHESCLFD